MRMTRLVAAAVSFFSCLSAGAQERLELELIPEVSRFAWSGTSNISGIVDPDFDPTYGWSGPVELEVTEGPNGPRARFDGADIALAPDIDGITVTALFAAVRFEDARISISSPEFDLALPATLQTQLTLTFTSGIRRVITTGGAVQSTPLAGTVIGTVPVGGSMGITALGDYQINVSLFEFQLDFDFEGFAGTITSTGFFHAEVVCPRGRPYCISPANATGSGARIVVQGHPSVSENAVVLDALFLPVNTQGLFYYGTKQVQVPLGDGVRCVGGRTFRLPVVTSSAQGVASFPLDLAGPQPAGGVILPGSTWNFQFWYRDPGGPGGSGFNLTDGAEVFFCP